MYQTAAPNGMYNNVFAQGVIPNQAAAMPKTGNWLSADKIALLQKGISQFKLSVTDEELAKGQCNHYNPNGTTALIQDADGSGGCTCTICNTHFTSREFTQEEVQIATQNILDILNTIKIMYLSIDPNAACEYFQIIPFIEKIPQLYQIAVSDFKKYEGVDNFINPQQQNPFGIFSMMVNPGYAGQMGQPMYQQPMAPGYGMPQQTPMGYAAPMPGYGMPQGYNPLYAGQPMMPNPGFVNPSMPMGNVPVAAPTTPAAAPAQEEVKVDTQFKK